MKNDQLSQRLLRYTFITALFIGLYFTTFYNYLLFHSLAESFSILIAGTVFIIAWHSRQYQKYDYLIFLGVAYLFIGFLDFLHTLSYKGMNIFADYDFYANQLWIATRYLESFSLAAAFSFFYIKKKLNIYWLILFYLLITIAITLSIFVFKVFPVCFIESSGLTAFKKISEYIICLILVGGMILLLKHKNLFEKKIFIYMILSFVFTIISELAFTFYISNYGLSNLIGHYFKVFSFYFIYRALIDTGIKDPYQLIFRELNTKNHELEQANSTKNKLFSIVSHDLRSAVGNLKNLAELLVDKEVSREEKENLSNLLYDSSIKTSTMLHTLLTWSKSQFNVLSQNPTLIELANMVIDITCQISSIAKEKSIKLISEVDNNIRVSADAEHVRIILRNLITNAIKFTPPGGEVTIYSKQKEQFIEIFVRDNGVGIKEEDIAILLSDMDYKSTPGTNSELGFGLGLKICKSFITLNKGKMSIRSEYGKGSIISFTLPVYNEKKALQGLQNLPNSLF